MEQLSTSISSVIDRALLSSQTYLSTITESQLQEPEVTSGPSVKKKHIFIRVYINVLYYAYNKLLQHEVHNIFKMNSFALLLQATLLVLSRGSFF